MEATRWKPTAGTRAGRRQTSRLSIRFHYYICFTRARYGTKAGRDAARSNAHAVDHAVRHALLDFYTTGGDLITQAVAEFQQAHQDGHADQRRELTAVQRDLATTQAAIDRYLTAFETGAMDADVCKPRLAELAQRAKQLRSRQAELTVAIDTPPAAPSPADLRQGREHIHRVVTGGTAGRSRGICHDMPG